MKTRRACHRDACILKKQALRRELSSELRFNAYLRRTKVYSWSIRARVVACSQSAFHTMLARSQWYHTWHRCICRHTWRKVRARLREDIANEAELCQSTSKRKHRALVKNNTLLERLSLCHNMPASLPSYRRSYKDIHIILPLILFTMHTALDVDSLKPRTRPVDERADCQRQQKENKRAPHIIARSGPDDPTVPRRPQPVSSRSPTLECGDPRSCVDEVSYGRGLC
jgi:hypothetical protein